MHCKNIFRSLQVLARPELGGTMYLGPFRTDHDYIQNRQLAGQSIKWKQIII